MPSRSCLRDIPVIAVGTQHGLASAQAAPAAVDELMRRIHRRYSALGMMLGDALSCRWLARAATPYADEIRAVARLAPRAGAIFLNLTFEWCCTTGAAPDPLHGGSTLVRVLDWRFEGLGDKLMAKLVDGAAGRYVSLSWPGYVGVLTGMAPGRFAAAINQPHKRSTRLGLVADWAAERRRFWRSRALPPSHLLRYVFESCADFAAARAMLLEREICTPAFFVLSGVEPHEACVIERLPTEGRARDLAACAANHWASFDIAATPRGVDSRARQRLMTEVLAGRRDWDFSWLAWPMLNQDTRVAALMNARTGRLLAQGRENGRIVTNDLDLSLRGGSVQIAPAA